MAEEFEDFVPEASAANSLLAELGKRPVARSERCALLGVSGSAVLRKSWTDAVELSEAEFATVRDAPEPAANLDQAGPSQHRMLDPESRFANAGRCSSCWVAVGKQICERCGGLGRHWPPAAGPVPSVPGTPCEPCSGSGQLACATCGGSGKSVKADLIFAEDRVTPFAHVFVPDVSYGLMIALSTFLRSRSRVPDCLRFALSDDHERVDAYRGRRGHEEYRGHQLGQTLARARHYLERVTAAPSVVRLRSSAHLWPFVRLELEDGGAAALVHDESHTACLIVPGA
jgi:hypothetical protein